MNQDRVDIQNEIFYCLVKNNHVGLTRTEIRNMVQIAFDIMNEDELTKEITVPYYDQKLIYKEVNYLLKQLFYSPIKFDEDEKVEILEDNNDALKDIDNLLKLPGKLIELNNTLLISKDEEERNRLIEKIKTNKEHMEIYLSILKRLPLIIDIEEYLTYPTSLIVPIEKTDGNKQGQQYRLNKNIMFLSKDNDLKIASSLVLALFLRNETTDMSDRKLMYITGMNTVEYYKLIRKNNN